MGAIEHSIWINARPVDVWRTYADPLRLPKWQTGAPGNRPDHGSVRTVAYFGLKFDVDTHLLPEADGTRLRLRAETHWPGGLGLLGKLVERAILSGSEARKELSNLKDLVEREAAERAAGEPPD